MGPIDTGVGAYGSFRFDLELPRFSGYPSLWEGGIHDVQDTAPLCA